VNLHIERRCGVAVLEPQPIVIEGLRTILSASGNFRLLEPADSLESLARLVTGSAPGVVIVDKSAGTPALVDWLHTIKDHASTAVIVWAAAMTDSEAVRLLKAGARGVIRKTAEPATPLACLEAVSAGSTWMEDSLFTEPLRPERGRADLTCREQQVLELVEQGLRNKDIAHELGIRPGTVKIHLKHIFEKTGVHGRFGLALSGMRERAPYLERLAS
jgi:DNA-binding NarL/FixJ family response regulator